MNILIAPDSFKESADAVTVAESIARGVRRAMPDATLDICPMADGGQGTVSALVTATDGQRRTVEVPGPLFEPVQATFGLLGEAGQPGLKTGGDCPLIRPFEKGHCPPSEPVLTRSPFSQKDAKVGTAPTAVIEMAAASGLELLPASIRDPMKTTTYGTGRLILAALDLGVQRIIVGIGGSATNDCGAGMAQAIGFRFFDGDGNLLPAGLSGGQLDRVRRIDGSGRDCRLDRTEIVVACDVSNPLTGPTGASYVYGPQKGATPQTVPILDDNLARFASLIECYLGQRIEHLAGAGAAGGLGGGLVAFAGGRLTPGVELVIEATRLAERLRHADLCITGEGRLDGQSLYGKTAIGVARLARSMNVPAIAIVGSADQPAATNAKLQCLDDYFETRPAGMPLAEAFARVRELIEQTAERAMRQRLGRE